MLGDARSGVQLQDANWGHPPRRTHGDLATSFIFLCASWPPSMSTLPLPHPPNMTSCPITNPEMKGPSDCVLKPWTLTSPHHRLLPEVDFLLYFVATTRNQLTGSILIPHAVLRTSVMCQLWVEIQHQEGGVRLQIFICFMLKHRCSSNPCGPVEPWGRGNYLSPFVEMVHEPWWPCQV